MSVHRLAAAVLAVTACGTSADGAPTPGTAPGPAPPAPLPTAVATLADAPLRPVPAIELGRADHAGTVVAVGIASRVGDRGTADATGKHARLGETVALHAVLEVVEARTTTIYADVASLSWRGKTVAPSPLADAPRVTIAWRKLEPTTANLSNTASGDFRYEAIPYAATAMDATGGTIAADVRPTRTPDHGGGVGTMRYQVVVKQGAREVASRGLEARRGRGAGGLAEDVHRITLRRDDSFLGYLTEMYGQPYIWASAGGTDRTHQSERLEGSDCADLMVYAARRAGFAVPYGYTGSLKQHARVVGAGVLAADGVYRDRAGVAVPFPQPGDLILFPRHVGALSVDRGQLGVVDVDDLMIHTLFDSPKEQAIRDSGYAANPIELLRWKPTR